jgi:hypothetical protein
MPHAEPLPDAAEEIPETGTETTTPLPDATEDVCNALPTTVAGPPLAPRSSRSSSVLSEYSLACDISRTSDSCSSVSDDITSMVGEQGGSEAGTIVGGKSDVSDSSTLKTRSALANRCEPDPSSEGSTATGGTLSSVLIGRKTRSAIESDASGSIKGKHTE